MSIQGKNIIITSPLSSAVKLRALLEKYGALVFDLPMIQTQKALPTLRIAKAFKTLNQFQWLIFTSKNGVKYFFEFLATDFPANIKTAVIGEATAQALKTKGIQPTFISKGRSSFDFLEELKKEVITSDQKILLALGNLAGNTLKNGLAEIASIKRIDIYETITEQNHNSTVLQKTKNGDYDWIFFTSPSAFEALLNLGIHPNQNKLVSIGPVTTAAMQSKGYDPAITARQSNIESMVNHLLHKFE